MCSRNSGWNVGECNPHFFPDAFSAQSIRPFLMMVCKNNFNMAGSALTFDEYIAEHRGLEKLRCARKAQYDHVDRPMCLRGTRTTLLQEIAEWMNDPEAPQVYWLNGAAGTGKSSIAQSASQMAANNGKLGASFFCSRDSADRSDMDRIFPTIAFQLCYRYSQIRSKVISAIKGQAADALPSEQLRLLITEPLQVLPSTGTIVVVIDALDECKDDNAPEIILLALARQIPSIPYLKVFVASRPAFSAYSTFKWKFPESLRRICILHEVERRHVDQDIRLYIEFRLQEMAHYSDNQDLSVPSWPPPDITDELVRKAEGLFIYASTVCKFVFSPGDPHHNLTLIVDSSGGVNKDHLGIDILYQTVLELAIKKFHDVALATCRSIIGTVILLRNPLSVADIAQILSLTPRRVRGTLQDLHSVLAVPDTDSDGTVHTFHASFHDWLTSESRSLPKMSITPMVQHNEIALCLFRCLGSGLKRNICNIDRFKLHTEVEDLNLLRSEKIPGWLQYACRYWPDHLASSGTTNPELVKAHEQFVRTKLLQWIEVVCLLGDLGSVISSIEKARNWNLVNSLSKLSMSLVLTPVYPASKYKDSQMTLTSCCLMRREPYSNFSLLSTSAPHKYISQCFYYFRRRHSCANCIGTSTQVRSA